MSSCQQLQRGNQPHDIGIFVSSWERLYFFESCLFIHIHIHPMLIFVLVFITTSRSKLNSSRPKKKLLNSSKMCCSLTAEWKHCQQKIRELELEVLNRLRALNHQNNLKCWLRRKSKVADAEDKVIILTYIIIFTWILLLKFCFPEDFKK